MPEHPTHEGGDPNATNPIRYERFVSENMADAAAFWKRLEDARRQYDELPAWCKEANGD